MDALSAAAGPLHRLSSRPAALSRPQRPPPGAPALRAARPAPLLAQLCGSAPKSCAAAAARKPRRGSGRPGVVVAAANGSPPAEAEGRVFGVPQRWILVAATSAAFVLCNMDKARGRAACAARGGHRPTTGQRRANAYPGPLSLTRPQVNMSVALIPMAQQYGWSGGERGLVRRAAQLGRAGSAARGRKVRARTRSADCRAPGRLEALPEWLVLDCLARGDGWQWARPQSSR